MSFLPATVDGKDIVEDRGEVCLAEEAERLWRSGMGPEEISRRMGVDAAWVETVISPFLANEPEKG